MSHHHLKPRAKRAEQAAPRAEQAAPLTLESAAGGADSHVGPARDPFHRWNPLKASIPIGEARELPFLDGWAQWDLATRLLQNNPPNPLVSAREPVLE